jgi:hypothetical protein
MRRLLPGDDRSLEITYRIAHLELLKKSLADRVGWVSLGEIDVVDRATDPFDDVLRRVDAAENGLGRGVNLRSAAKEHEALLSAWSA